MRKYIVLTILFVLPLVVYLFFASGINHFAQLPVLKNNVTDVSDYSQESFKNKITILGFFGSNVQDKHGDALNLNQKIYKRFYQFKDFQFLMIQPFGTDSLVLNLKNDLRRGTDTDLINWKFISLGKEELNSVFNSLNTNISLDSNYGTPYVLSIIKT